MKLIIIGLVKFRLEKRMTSTQESTVENWRKFASVISIKLDDLVKDQVL